MIQRQNAVIETISELSLAFAKAISLVSDGERSAHEVMLLIRSLQLFCEGKLAGVTSADFYPPFGQTTTSDRKAVVVTECLDTSINVFLSLPLEESALPLPAREDLESMGIRYLGEIMMAKNYLRRSKRAPLVRKFFSTNVGVDPDTHADWLLRVWRPPYWSDQNLLALLNCPLSEAIIFSAENVRKLVNALWQIGKSIPELKDARTSWGRRSPEIMIKRLKEYAATQKVSDLLALRAYTTYLHPYWSQGVLQAIHSLLLPEFGIHAGFIIPDEQPVRH
jgi:hypothetical protein